MNDCLTPGCNRVAFVPIVGTDAQLCVDCHEKYRADPDGRIIVERLISQRSRQALAGQSKLL